MEMYLNHCSSFLVLHLIFFCHLFHFALSSFSIASVLHIFVGRPKMCTFINHSSSIYWALRALWQTSILPENSQIMLSTDGKNKLIQVVFSLFGTPELKETAWCLQTHLGNACTQSGGGVKWLKLFWCTSLDVLLIGHKRRFMAGIKNKMLFYTTDE